MLEVLEARHNRASLLRLVLNGRSDGDEDAGTDTAEPGGDEEGED